MKRTLAVRLGFPLLGIILAVASLLGWFIVREQRADLYESANTAVKSGISSVREVLSATDQLSREKVEIAMRTLRSRGASLGVPSLGGKMNVGVEIVPALALGSTIQTNNFGLVDQATAVAGGTATLFVRRGDDFVRVSTNVKKSDGTRAIGTLLDPNGKAIAAIKSGQPFYGVVDILGAPFMTGYEPMRNSREEVIGIWYTGYPLSSLDKVKQALAVARVLDGGFCAVLDAKGKVLFRSQHVSDEHIAGFRDQPSENGWVIQSELFPAWGYTIVAGYPLADVQLRLNRIIAIVAGGFLAMVIGITLALVMLVRRLVAIPLRAVARSMEDADLNSVLSADRADEIGQLSRAFDGFVESIRTTLFKVTEASSAVASASSEISSSTEEMATGSQEQTAQTGEVASAVEEMTKTIVENSRNASQTAETAHAARAAAEKGGAGGGGNGCRYAPDFRGGARERRYGEESREIE